MPVLDGLYRLTTGQAIWSCMWRGLEQFGVLHGKCMTCHKAAKHRVGESRELIKVPRISKGGARVGLLEPSSKLSDLRLC